MGGQGVIQQTLYAVTLKTRIEQLSSVQEITHGKIFSSVYFEEQNLKSTYVRGSNFSAGSLEFYKQK